jgi:polyvinyl alcohol dehydrogenase (cytochrome)
MLRTAHAHALAVAVVAVGLPSAARAQTPPDAAALFAAHCARCHEAAGDARAPSRDALRGRTPQSIVLALTNGSMRLQGSRLGGVERRAVAEYLTGRPFGTDVAGAATGRCATTRPLVADGGPEWSGWGNGVANTRFQSGAAAALTPERVRGLTLAWALGFPDATHAWAQPTVTGGRLFVGSQNGTVYALDAKTGCIHWTFSAAGGVRTAIAIGPASNGVRRAYFGDTNATVYALDAETGREIWRRRVDDHPLGRVTGSPTLFEGRLYVPTSSYEEVDTASPDYECCTFRGSLSALDAATGAVIWKTYTSGEPTRRGTSSTGRPLWGPSGSAIWSAPTVDAARRVVYAATGNTYSEPAEPTSDAVIAFDLATGRIRWTRQVTPNDVYIGGCKSGSGNPNCAEVVGPDFDFGNAPILTTTRAGRDLIVIGQKSGVGFAMDPDREGQIVWQYRAGQGSALGGMEYGSAVDADRAYFPVSDVSTANPGGLHAVDLSTGARVWYAAPPAPACGTGRGCNGAQAAAITVIPGVVFSGSNDGALRAYATADGAILWTFDTNREFLTVNGVPGRGASIMGPGPAVAGGMVYVNSGYGSHGGRAGNVLLAFEAP